MSIDKLAEFAKDGDKNLDNLDVSKGFLQSEKPERQWFNKLFNLLTNKVNEVVDNIDGLPPFEGGGLADTFVTVTSNLPDSVPRNLRDVLADSVSITDFGRFANGGDWTSAFHKAVATGREVVLPEGVYGLRCDNFDCQGKDLILKGTNAEIVLLAGTGLSAFNISGCDKVKTSGIKWRNDNDSFARRIFTADPTSSIGGFEMTGDKFVGRTAVMRIDGSKTQLPSIAPYGFRTLKFNGNDVSENTTTLIRIDNYPVPDGELLDNKIHNMSYSILYVSLVNGSANNDEISKINTVIADNNTVTCDDDFWAVDTLSPYYCVLLIEGKSVTWTNNNISGMKCNSVDTALYDAYLSCPSVTSTGNTYKNNANFAPNAPNNWLIKCKSDSSADRPTTKVIKGNTYTIERDWLKRIGNLECTHKLYNTGWHNSGEVSIEDNTFNIYGLDVDQAHNMEKASFKRNTINAKKLTGASPSYIFALSAYTDGVSTLDLVGNTVNIEDANSKTIGFLSDTSTSNTYWGDLSVLNNTYKVAGVAQSTSIMRSVRAITACINNNNFDTDMTYDYTGCTFKKLFSRGNNFVGAGVTKAFPFSFTAFLGRTSLNQSYYGAINRLRLKLPISSPVLPNKPNTNFLVKFEFFTSQGVSSIEFKYTLQQANGIFSIAFVDNADAAKTATIGTTEENGTTIKSELSGTGGLALLAKIVNSTTDPYINITGFPVSECAYTVSISGFEG